jgi:hypothetical protein
MQRVRVSAHVLHVCSPSWSNLGPCSGHAVPHSEGLHRSTLAVSQHGRALKTAGRIAGPHGTKTVKRTSPGLDPTMGYFLKLAKVGGKLGGMVLVSCF